MNTNQIQALEIQLKAQKERYKVGEPIEVVVVLKNMSGNPITVNSRLGVNPGHLPECLTSGF